MCAALEAYPRPATRSGSEFGILFLLIVAMSSIKYQRFRNQGALTLDLKDNF